MVHVFIMILHNQSWAHKEEGRNLTVNFGVLQEGKKKEIFLSAMEETIIALWARFRL